MAEKYDAIVVGSGPNGLAAAITLARAGKSVLLREGASSVGGAMRSAPLTLDGFTHDICSTVHAMAGVSPFFRSIPPEQLGVEYVKPKVAFAQPLFGGGAAIVEESLDATAAALGPDAGAWLDLFRPLLARQDRLFPALLGPLRLTAHPLLLARFGRSGIQSAVGLTRRLFRTEAAAALFAGAAAHSVLDLRWPATAAFGLMLSLSAHTTGWPVVRGGSQKLADGLARFFQSLGGTIQLEAPVESLDQLPAADAFLLDVTPRQLLKIAGDRLPEGYRRQLSRFQYGPGAFKMDWALSAPIPWENQRCREAGTLHLCGTLEEVVAAEAAPWRGEHASRPYVLLVQPTVMDPTRAPPGKHVAWAYCHVPNGSVADMSDLIESQIERFAPGFRDTILSHHTMRTDQLEHSNPNLVGGDINGGASFLSQLFARPVASLDPYATPLKQLYLCSSSTPPGGGVHGMCGYFAARSALRRSFR